VTDVATTRTRRREKALPAALGRHFEAVVFDWDGTAVPDRAADAERLRALIEELCALGLDLAVVTGTSGMWTASSKRDRPARERCCFR
jgi:dihydrodipicolinate synthase/N-acetylneuraminate lyase